jgi:hypothetical protein
MPKLIFFFLLLVPSLLFGQSKSITRFRSDFKENSNMFFYSSTLKMLNSENNPELADLLSGVEEIRVLNYKREEQKLKNSDIAGLKNALKNESYNNIMMINDKGNSINLYSREKNGKMTGFVAIVENTVDLILIDLTGSIDVKKFMQLKQKLDMKTGNSI